MSDDRKTRLIRDKKTEPMGKPGTGQADKTIVLDPETATQVKDEMFQQAGASGATRHQEMQDGSAGATSSAAKPETGGPRTRIFKPSSEGAIRSTEPGPEQTGSVVVPEVEPVTGWLVVIKGPGYGNTLPISYKKHAIGRDPDQEISLDFGDSTLSRKDHAFIEYDYKERVFYLWKGDNYVYVNGESLRGKERELANGDEISLGTQESTALRFVAFCDDRFDWLDREKKTES